MSRRIVLVCAKRSLYAAFSVLPYGDSSSQLRYITILTVPSSSFMICHLVFIHRHHVRAASRRPRLILCDSLIFCLKQRPEAGGPETEAVVRGGHRPPALSGGHGAGLLREGKLSGHVLRIKMGGWGRGGSQHFSLDPMVNNALMV